MNPKKERATRRRGAKVSQCHLSLGDSGHKKQSSPIAFSADYFFQFGLFSKFLISGVA
jgi:hypothetical protein